MKVLAINGSPRGKESCTEEMLRPLLEGMQDAGAKTEIIYLANKNIHHCIGCFSCWLQTPGVCVFKDDMPQLLEKMRDNVDMLVIGAPLYFFTMTGLLKNFMDRTLPLALPFMEKNKDGMTTHPFRYPGMAKKLFLVSPCGFPELEHFDALVSTFKQIAIAGSQEYLGEILRPAAGLMKVEHFEHKLKEYKILLRKAGRQLIENNVINKKILKTLHESWISQEEFQKLANEYFQGEIDKLDGK